MGKKQQGQRTNDVSGNVALSDAIFTIKPGLHEKIVLGEFSGAVSAKGFLVEFENTSDKDSVEVQILSIGTAEQHTLVLHAINYGNKVVTVTARPL